MARNANRPEPVDRPRTCSGPPEAATTKPGIDSPVFSLLVTTGAGNTSEVPISADLMADLLRSVPDCRGLGWIFDIAARHPAMKIRSSVARYDNLSAEAVRLLSMDPCAEIRRQLISSPALKRHATTEMLLSLAASDPMVAEELAERLHDFTCCDVDLIEAELAVHPDPSVRLFLAHNGEVSLRTIMQLAQDADPGVAYQAQRQTDTRLDMQAEGAEDMAAN